MVAVSKHTDTAYRGVDLSIAITYTPPEGEALDGLTITAALHSLNASPVPSVVLFDQATGSVRATWSEASTKGLPYGAALEARFVRDRGGDSRVFYVRRVEVR